MADLSALPTNTVKTFEQLAQFLGAEGITVDGDASEIGEAQVVDVLDKFSRALGGEAVTVADFTDPEKQAAIVERVKTSVEEFRDSPQMKLFGEVLKGKDVANPELIAKHVQDMGLTGATAAVVPTLAMGLLQSMPSPAAAAAQLLSMAEEESPELQKIKEILGPDVLGKVDQTIAFLQSSDDWFEVVRAVGDAVVVAVPDAATGVAADDIAVAPVAEPVVSDATPDDGHVSDLVTPAGPASTDTNAAAIFNVETRLFALVPVIQGELDKQRGKAAALIDEIDGKVSPERLEEIIEERRGLQTQMDALDSVDPLSPEQFSKRVDLSARYNVLTAEMSGGDSNIAQFIDNFLLGTIESDLGHRIVEMGKGWAKGAIHSNFVGIYDIPPMGPIDGVLDMHDQAALQGTLFLLSKNFNIRLEDTWRYRPELGKILTDKLEKASFEDQEKLVLGFMKGDATGLAAYEEMSKEEKVAFLKQKMVEYKDEITEFISSLDTLHAAGLLVDKQLYSLKPLAVAPVVQDIFRDYIGTGDEQISAEHAGFLNGLVNEFTEGIGLKDAVGKGFSLPGGMKAFAGDMTEFYREAFDDAGATSAAGFESTLDKDHMLAMIETMPFGSVERREAFKAAVNKAFDAARQAEAANNDDAANIAVLTSAAFGQSLATSMAEINADPKMHSNYLFSSDRPVLMHPDLDDKVFEIEDGSSMSSKDVFAIYKRVNNDFESRDEPGKPLEEIDHQPLYFKDEAGNVYIAMIDAQSYVLDIQPLNIDALDQAIKDGVGYDGLVEISPGFGLAFQDMGDNPRWNVGTSMNEGDFVENVRRSTWKLGAFRASAPVAPTDEANNVPEEGVTRDFGVAAEAAEAEARRDAVNTIDEFQATREQILTPVVSDAAAGAEGLTPGAQPNAGGR